MQVCAKCLTKTRGDVMRRVLTSQAVIDQYIETCSILKETTLSGDYRKGNKEGKKIIKVFKELENNTELAIQSLPKLFSDPNVVTRTTASAHCLSLNICVDDATTVLEEIANDQSNAIFGFNAEMTLKVYREQGYIKMYKEQEPRYAKLVE